MKHFHIILLFLALPLFSFSQWTYLNSGVTNDLNEVFFVNGSVGFAIGFDIVLKTTDGGQTWIEVPTGSTGFISGIWFTSTTTGFVSAYDQLLKTTDQGATWTTVDIGDASYSGFHFGKIFFANAMIGYVIKQNSYESFLDKTTDGGNTWDTLSYDFRYITSTYFSSPDSGMVAGFPEFSGEVFGTKDGAQTWKVLLDGAYHQYSIVTASPNKTLYTYDYAEDNFYYSYNGGGTWHHYYLPDLNGNDGTIDFTSASVGWATSFPEFNGSIMKSIDGGLSWQHDTTVTSNLSALQFPSPDTGYAVGDGGVIMKYVAPCPVTATILPAGNIIACKGTDVILTCGNAGNSFNYQWEKDGVAIPGATDQTYTNLKDEATFDVIVTSAFGCSDTSDPISIDRLKKPKATITALGNLDICNTGSVDLQATSGNNFLYQWKKNGNNISGATNQVYTATTTGGYKVKITNANGCSKTSKVTSVTTSCKEISPATNEDAFTLFPNPSSGNLSIQLSGDFTSSPLKISITDVLGRKVWEEENIPEGNFISLQFDEKMTNGIYLFTIQSQHASAQKLFEVQR